MQEPEVIKPATVPAQPEATAPMKKGGPLLYLLVGGIALIGITNLSGFISGKGKEAPRSAMPQRPSAANPQQVSSFQNQQALQTAKDQEDRARQQQVTAAQLQQMQAEQNPGPEADAAAPMTPAQRQAIYGPNSPNAPKQTSNASQANAEAKQRVLAREKQHQDALNSDTVAIDFAQPPRSRRCIRLCRPARKHRHRRSRPSRAPRAYPAHPCRFADPRCPHVRKPNRSHPYRPRVEQSEECRELHGGRHHPVPRRRPSARHRQQQRSHRDSH